MKFFADQDIYGVTTRFLVNLGHNVSTASQLGLQQASDEILLQVAAQKNFLFLTRDRDFGGLVYVRGLKVGVIYLRMRPATRGLVHDELQRVLSLYTAEQIRYSFLVIEAGRHRLRKLPS